jgi:hypothetical protein
MNRNQCTKTSGISNQAQLDEYQQYFDNARRLRELVREIESISLEAVEKDPRWQTKG